MVSERADRLGQRFCCSHARGPASSHFWRTRRHNRHRTVMTIASLRVLVASLARQRQLVNHSSWLQKQIPWGQRRPTHIHHKVRFAPSNQDHKQPAQAIKNPSSSSHYCGCQHTADLGTSHKENRRCIIHPLRLCVCLLEPAVV